MRYRLAQAKFWVKRGPRHVYERVRYGVSYMDAWNLDVYLARVIGRGTHLLAENTHTYPPQLTPESWNAILREIGRDFRAYDAEAMDTTPSLERGFELLKIHFPHLWD